MLNEKNLAGSNEKKVWQPRSFEEKKIQDLIKDRFDLYFAIIDEANVGEKTKIKIKELLSDFGNRGTDDMGLRIADLLDSILSCTDKDSNKAEALSLFLNLRDDLWSLHDQELKK